ncbi:ABC transporter substrate-binding protein [Bacillus sp. 522_BSPC]|uniref:ABC transporter substrate-binding protein n=1 Tax=Bacillus sp. 522_BSPC TaxID=1579338 RepID=UPI00065FC938|nr:ABC transporter substrate-binding protein [Bacillus sp. 522_BSPC]
MYKKSLIFALLFVLILSGCSMSVSKESDTDEGLKLPVTENLPEDRKVREIEMYVTTPDYDAVRYEFGLMTAEEWKKLGFDVKVTPLEWNRLSEVGIQKKEYDSFTLSWAGRAERIDPDHFIYATLDSSQSGIGGYNVAGYDNPKYDKLAEEQRKVTDPAQRKEIVKEAQELFLEDIPYAPVAYRDQIMPYNKANFTNVKYMVGEGLNSFWTFMAIEPTGEQKYVRWGYPSDINSLNPLSSTNSHDFQVTRLIYDSLVRISETGEPKNWAAESITDKNGDGKTYEVKLRSDMKFHDGKPVTANDVKFSFDLVKEVESPYFMGMVKPIESVEVIDDLTVRFNLTEEYSPFISNTLAQMYIFPEHYWKPLLDEKGAQGVLENQNLDIVGSGPFKLDYWKRDQEMKLDTNKEYFTPAKVDGILSIPYSNTETMVAAVAQGQADIGGWWIEPTQVEDLKENDQVEVISVKDIGLYHINYNIRRMPFDDKAVRQALTYTIPKERIVNEILEGYGETATALISPANEYWFSDGLKGYDYDFDAAVNALKEAGYEWDENGKIYYPEGKTDQDKSNGIVKEVE